MSSETDMPVMSVTLDDADIEWVQRRALHHLQLVNERTAEVRWKEFGYYGTFPLALLAAFWFRRGWIVNWLTAILLAIVLGMAWTSDANAQESSSTKSEAPNSKQNQLPISKSEAPNLKEAQDPASDLVLRVSNLTPQFGAWFSDISEVSNLGFGAWSLRFAEVPSLGFRAWLLELVEGWFLTLNQQGRWYFDRGEYATAAGLVVVGQPVKLVVDVLVTTWFTSASEFPVFDLPGASGNFANIGSRRSHLTPRPIPTTGRRLRRRRYEASEAVAFSELVRCCRSR